MRTRIRRRCLGYTTHYYPEYKSSVLMPWRRITNKNGEKIYASKNGHCLEHYVEDVAAGKRPPTYPKKSVITWRSK